jgi:hypothetical protein
MHEPNRSTRFSRKDFPNPKDKTGIPMKSENVESATEKGKKEIKKRKWRGMN